VPACGIGLADVREARKGECKCEVH
jgi:hypothetical protein